MSTHTDKASVNELERYLHVLAGREPAGALLELRFRRAPGRSMRQRFYPAARARRAAETALWLSQTGDVYVGVLPRRRRAGGKAALERASAPSARAIARFRCSASRASTGRSRGQ